MKMTITSPIAYILFDVGNVLIEYRPVGLSIAAESLEVPMDQMLSFFIDNEAGVMVRTGKLSPQQFVDRLNDHFRCSVTPSDIVTWFGPEVGAVYPEIPGLLDSLKDRYSLGTLSNTFFAQWDNFAKTELFLIFDIPMASHLLGYTKPDPRIFHVALEKIKAAPAEVLFIDDKPANVDAAKGIGIEAFVAKGGREVFQGLQRLGVIGEELSNP